MSSYNAILARAQKALATYLGQFTFTGWSPAIIRGITQTTRTLPCIICDCSAASHEEIGEWTGNWKADIRISVRENADDTTEEQHLEHAGDVFDKIVVDSIVGDINLAAGSFFTAHQCVPGDTSYSVVDRSWESTLTLTLYCAGGVSPYTYSTYNYDMGYVTEQVVEVIDMAA